MTYILGTKLKWGSTKYLKVGALYLLRDKSTAFFPVRPPDEPHVNSLELPRESYLLYLGINKRAITYWQFFHLALGQKIEAGNNDFAKHILEVSEPTT